MGKVWKYCDQKVDKPKEILYDGSVVNVDDFVHIIGGKPVCWNKDDIDMQNVPLMILIIDIVRKELYDAEMQPRVIGDNKVAFLFRVDDIDGDMTFGVTDRFLDELPEATRHNITNFCDYYKG